MKQGFLFINQIKEILAYWKSFTNDQINYVVERWHQKNEFSKCDQICRKLWSFFFFGRYLLLILDGMNLWKLFQKFNSLSFSLRILVNCNALSLARNFQHRLKFFKRNIAHNMRTIKLKVKYHARRVKFHFCGLSNVNWISLDNKCICSKWKLNK